MTEPGRPNRKFRLKEEASRRISLGGAPVYDRVFDIHQGKASERSD